MARRRETEEAALAAGVAPAAEAPDFAPEQVTVGEIREFLAEVEATCEREPLTRLGQTRFALKARLLRERL
jgi:hypothetical protein